MRHIKIWALALLAGTVLLASCTKEEDNAPDTIQEQIQSSLMNGTWRIALYQDSGVDETYHFTGYSFTFQNTGVLIASNGINSYEGTWSITDSNSNDDSKDDLDFNIFFNLTNEFEDLIDDWDIVSQSPVKIELIDISGGNGGTDYLTFEKN